MLFKLINRIIFELKLATADQYKRPLLYKQQLNLKIGDEARFTGKINFGSEPQLITIGNHVTLAHNVTFLNHDGGVWVFRKKYPNINVFGKIEIGNNVFVGSNVVILPNITIGDNVVIGTGSIVTKSIPSNVVAVGSPARVVRTIDEYEEKVLKSAVFHTKNELSK